VSHTFLIQCFYSLYRYSLYEYNIYIQSLMIRYDSMNNDNVNMLFETEFNNFISLISLYLLSI